MLVSVVSWAFVWHYISHNFHQGMEIFGIKHTPRKLQAEEDDIRRWKFSNTRTSLIHSIISGDFSSLGSVIDLFIKDSCHKFVLLGTGSCPGSEILWTHYWNIEVSDRELRKRKFFPFNFKIFQIGVPQLRQLPLIYIFRTLVLLYYFNKYWFILGFEFIWFSSSNHGMLQFRIFHIW